MKKREIIKENKGITIVALVITIIVLLVLAGVSLNLVLGENGIVKKAQEARNKTIKGQLNTEKSINDLTEEADNYLGHYDLSRYTVGEEVAYTYDKVSEGYLLPSNESGCTNDQKVSQDNTSIKWIIINKDESTGTVDLISDKPTGSIVALNEALGYNNGVYLLNDICDKLYSNTSKKIKARSINLEDIEKHLTDSGFAVRNAYGNAVKYGVSKTYTSSKQYPKLYANQIGAGITSTNVTQPNKIKAIDPYKESSQGYTYPTSETSEMAGDSGLTVTQTFYYIPINEKNYGEVANILLKTNLYWVASRYVYTSSSCARFGLRCVATYMGGSELLYSDGTSNRPNFSLRPIVSLKANMLTGEKDENGAWTLK